MIKCNVTICGLINYSAIEKETKEGDKFLAFGVTIPIAGRDGTAAEMQINVTTPGDASTKAEYSTGRRVLINGTLMIRSTEAATYYNLRSNTLEFCSSTELDRVVGSMEFKGKIHDEIANRESKTGRKFQTFSGFSSDKDGEKRGFTWVHFLNPLPIKEDWLSKGKYVEISGDLSINAYKNNINIECRTNDIKEWLLPQK